MEAYRSWFVRCNGIKTHFVEAGSGDPVVLIHGGGPGASGEHNWQHNIPALAEHFHVFALDLLGYGLTDKPAIDYTYAAKVDQVASFIDTLCLDRVFIGGNSLGAYIAVRYALDHPDRINKVLMVATATVANAMNIGTTTTQGATVRGKVGTEVTEETMRAWLGMLLHNKDRITDDIVRRRVAYGNIPGAIEAQQSYRAHSAKIKEDPNLQQWFDISTRLPKATFPMALIWGKEDQFASPELASGLRAALPNLTEFHLVEGSGHQVQNDQSEKFNEIAVRFLRS